MAVKSYRLIVHGTYPGVDQILNVFYYVGDGVDISANDLLAAFNTGILPTWTAAVSVDYFITHMEAYALDDAADFGSLSVGTDGDRTGEALPGFVSWTFRLNRTVRTVRNGRKAFVGVSEGDIGAQGAPTTAQIARLTAFSNVLGLVLDGATSGDTYSPAVLHTIINGVPQTPPGTLLGVSSVDFVRVSSQNTRKK